MALVARTFPNAARMSRYQDGYWSICTGAAPASGPAQ